MIYAPARSQESCVTVEQYYQGLVNTDAQYCTLETKIATAKHRAKSYGIIEGMHFKKEEIRIIQDRYQYISFINIAQFENFTADFPESELGMIDLAFMSLQVDSADMDETHHILLHGFLLTKRRLLLENYLDTKLATLKSQSDALLHNDAEFLGLKGSPDMFYLCYWKTFVPGRAVQETVVSPLFLRCTEEN